MAALVDQPDEIAAMTALIADGSNGIASHPPSGISAGEPCHPTISSLQTRLCYDYNVLTCYTQMRLLYTTARSDYGAFKRKKRYGMPTYSSLP
jgi:hypothetical protein